MQSASCISLLDAPRRGAGFRRCNFKELSCSEAQGAQSDRGVTSNIVTKELLGAEEPPVGLGIAGGGPPVPCGSLGALKHARLIPESY